MTSQVRTISLAGKAAVWDGTNLQEIRDIAGDAYRGVEMDLVILHDEQHNGDLAYLKPGSTLARLNDRVIVLSPHARETLLSEN